MSVARSLSATNQMPSYKHESLVRRNEGKKHMMKKDANSANSSFSDWWEATPLNGCSHGLFLLSFISNGYVH